MHQTGGLNIKILVTMSFMTVHIFSRATRASWLMNMEGTNVTLTYEAEGREPVKLRVRGNPIIGETSLRAKLYNLAVDVKPENLETAIKLLQTLT